jgi:azurin
MGSLDKKIMGHNVVILNKSVGITTFAAKATTAKDKDYIPSGTTEIIAHTKMIGAKESTPKELTAPAVGEYDFICSFPEYFGAMKGKFIVK